MPEPRRSSSRSIRVVWFAWILLNSCLYPYKRKKQLVVLHAQRSINKHLEFPGVSAMYESCMSLKSEEFRTFYRWYLKAEEKINWLDFGFISFKAIVLYLFQHLFDFHRQWIKNMFAKKWCRISGCCWNRVTAHFAVSHQFHIDIIFQSTCLFAQNYWREKWVSIKQIERNKDNFFHSYHPNLCLTFFFDLHYAQVKLGIILIQQK